MPDIPVVTIGAPLSFVDPDENLNFMENDEHTLLAVEISADIVGREVTIVSVRDCDQGHGAENAGVLVDRVEHPDDGPVTMFFGFFDKYRFNQNGKIQVKLNDKNGVRLGGLRVPHVR